MIPNEDGGFYPHSGGSVFNTAIGLGRQSVEVGFLSGVSTDFFGEVLMQDLTESQVATNYLIRSDRPTTLAFVKLIEGKASYAFFDENTAGRMIASDDLPSLSETTKALFFGGISLAVEPCADTYLALLKRNAQNHLIMVDPNIRPSFIKDEARYRQRLGQFLAHANIIKISDDDLEWLDPSARSVEEKANALMGGATSQVCVTFGANGAYLFREGRKPIDAQAPQKQVVDTVGAGDAFNAGFLTMLARFEVLDALRLRQLPDDLVEEVLQFATAFAGDSVLRAGSNPAWNFSLDEK